MVDEGSRVHFIHLFVKRMGFLLLLFPAGVRLKPHLRD